MNPRQSSHVVWLFGRCTLDERRLELTVDGETVAVEARPMELLLFLLRNAGELVTKDQLLDAVWPGRIPSESVLTKTMAKLRQALRDDDQSLIRTVYGQGYRLIADVRTRIVEACADEATPPAETPNAAAPAAPPVVTNASPAVARRAWIGGAAAAVVAGVGLWRWGLPTAQANPPRVAVLPFSDGSGGQMDQPLCATLSLDVIGALQAYRGLEVIAFNSVQALGDGERDLGQVARRLAATHAVRGRVDRRGERVRIDTELVSVPHDAIHKTAVYETTMDRLSTLPRDIAAELAGALGAQPARALQPLAPSAGYELYILGRYTLRQRGAASILKARDYFQRGIELDPRYFRNHVGLGWTWVTQAETGFGISWDEGLARAQPAFDRALALAPKEAEVLGAQAMVLYKLERFDEARKLIQAALIADPGDAQAHFTAGAIEIEDAWPLRAVAPLQTVTRLDPLNAGPHWKLASALAFAGQIDAARDACRRGLALEPNSSWCQWLLGTTEFGAGHLGAAVDAYRQTLKIEPKRLYTWNQLGWVQLDLGLPDAADASFRAAADLLPDRQWPRLDRANVWLFRGAKGAPPAELELAPSQMAEATDVLTLLMLRALAGLSIDTAALDAALARLRSNGTPLHESGWQIYHCHNRLTDVATLYAAAGRADRATAYAAEAQQQLDRFEQRGNRGFGLALARATLFALRGDRDAALRALNAAVDTGLRRSWLLRRDPAFAALRQEAAFTALTQRIDDLTARDRARSTT